MSERGTPAVVGLSEGLGPLPERDAFEQWFSNGGKYPPAVQRSGEGYALAAAQAAWNAWKAGAAAEREWCARIAETPVSGEQDDITMAAKDRIAAWIRRA